MQYDFYNRETFYKPGLAVKARDRLHRILFKGLNMSSILEIGIGFGELADYCGRNNISWVGIDANENLVNEVREKGLPVYRAVMPDFPEVKEKYQAIFAAHFIEHLKDYREALKFLEECRERLKEQEKGYLILLYPDIEKMSHFFWVDYTHSFVTTKKRVEDMLYDCGFKIVRSGRYTACFFLTSGLISLVGKFFPYFLLPKRVALFARLSFQQHVYTIGIPS
jgi:predicted TPR repeat methyltransferase